MTIRRTTRPNALIALLPGAFGRTAWPLPRGLKLRQPTPGAPDPVPAGRKSHRPRAGLPPWMDARPACSSTPAPSPGAWARPARAHRLLEGFSSPTPRRPRQRSPGPWSRPPTSPPRSRRLDIVGPGGNAAVPGTRRWLAPFGPEGYRYLPATWPTTTARISLPGASMWTRQPQGARSLAQRRLVVVGGGRPHGPIRPWPTASKDGFLSSWSAATLPGRPRQAAPNNWRPAPPSSSPTTPSRKAPVPPPGAPPIWRRRAWAPSPAPPGGRTGAEPPHDPHPGASRETNRALIRKAHRPLRFAEDPRLPALGPSPAGRGNRDQTGAAFTIRFQIEARTEAEDRAAARQKQSRQKTV